MLRAARCGGLTVSGRPCRNQAPAAGGWCGRCGGVPSPVTAPPLSSLSASAAGDPLAANPWIPPTGPGAARRLAADPDTDPEALHRLAVAGWSARWAVAGNPSTAPETLALLALDDSEEVRLRAAQHPACPPAARSRVGLEIV